MSRLLAVLAACAACSTAHEPPSAASPCAAIVIKLRTALGYAMVGTPDQIERVASVVARSCEHDHWPPELVQCLLLVSPTDRAGIEHCHGLVPPALETALTRQVGEALAP